MSGAEQPNTREVTIRRVLVATFVLNAAVSLAKLGYGFWADALAIRADGFHSLVDAMGNVIAWVGISLAAKPPDPEHPYGHRKIEVMLAAGVGMLLVLTAVSVARDASLRVLGSTEATPRIDRLAFVVLLVTLAINIFVSWWEERVGRQQRSPLLITDAQHTRTDVVVTIGVTVSSFLTLRGMVLAAAVASVLVALFVGYTGVRLLLSNAGVLLDSAALDTDRVFTVARAVDGVHAVSHVRTRGAPGALAVDLRVQVDPALTVARGHAIGHQVSDALHAAFSDIADVVVHVEPKDSP
jgi:cation diffusion facilitator family transporter